MNKLLSFTAAAVLTLIVIYTQAAFSAEPSPVVVPAATTPAPAATEQPAAKPEPVPSTTNEPDASADAAPAGDHAAHSMPSVPRIPAPVAAAFHADVFTVRVVQHALSTLGAYTGPINGVPDEATVAAIQRYQAEHGLTPTGMADYNLLAHIRAGQTFSRANAAVAAQVPDTATCDPLPSRWIKWTQSLLASRRIYTGNETGIVDRRTRDAIAHYQKLTGLPASGCISPRLIQSLLKDLPDAPAPAANTGVSSADPSPFPGHRRIDAGRYNPSSLDREPTSGYPKYSFNRQPVDPGHPRQPGVDACSSPGCPGSSTHPNWPAVAPLHHAAAPAADASRVSAWYPVAR